MSKEFQRVQALSLAEFASYMRAHGVPGSDAKFRDSIVAGVYAPEIVAAPKRNNCEDYWFTITVAACDRWIKRNASDPAEESNPIT